MSGVSAKKYTHEEIKATCIKNVPGWSQFQPEDVNVVQLAAGLTNYLFRVWITPATEDVARTVLFRVFGESGDSFYSPAFEKKIFRTMSTIDRHFAPSLVAEVEGGRIEEWIYGKALPIEYLRCANMLHEIANAISRFHYMTIDPRFPKEFLEREPCQFRRIYSWCDIAKKCEFPKGSDNAKWLEKYDMPYREKCIDHLKNALCLKDAKHPIFVNLRGERYEPCPYMMRLVFAHNDTQENNMMLPERHIPDDHSVSSDGARNVNFDHDRENCKFAYQPNHESAPSTCATPQPNSGEGFFERDPTSGRILAPASAEIVNNQFTSPAAVPECWVTSGRKTCNCLPPRPAPLLSETPTIRLIDFEYSDVNFAGFDLCSTMCESMVDYTRSGVHTNGFAVSPEGFPSRSLRRSFVRAYLSSYFKTINREEEPSEFEVDRGVDTVDRLCLAAHLLWTFWSIIRAEQTPNSPDFDFMHYGYVRCMQYDSFAEELGLPKAGEEHLLVDEIFAESKNVQCGCFV